MKYWLVCLYIVAAVMTAIDWAVSNQGIDSFLLAAMFMVAACYESDDVKRKERLRK